MVFWGMMGMSEMGQRQEMQVEEGEVVAMRMYQPSSSQLVSWRTCPWLHLLPNLHGQGAL